MDPDLPADFMSFLAERGLIGNPAAAVDEFVAHIEETAPWRLYEARVLAEKVREGRT